MSDMARDGPEQWAQHGPAYLELMTRITAERAAEATARQQRDTNRNALWSAATMPPIPFLQSLYDAVLAHSESRMPKWKFRLASDLLLEMQPKLTRTGRLFHWRALRCEAADAKLLAAPRDRLRGGAAMLLSGILTDRGNNGGCILRPRYVWPLERHSDYAAQRLLRDRVAAAFTEGRFDRFQSEMLLHFCLICG